MAYQCSVCGKKRVSGNNVSHSNRHTRTKWLPNLQRVRVLLEGKVQRVLVCTNCIKSGKIVKAVKRDYQPAVAAAQK